MADAEQASIGYSKVCASVAQGDSLSAIKHAITLSKASFKTLSSSPMSALYQLQLHNTSETLQPAVVVHRRLLMLHHLCKMNVYSSLATVHLGAGLSLVCALKQLDTEDRSAAQKQLIRHLSAQKMTIIVDILKIAKLLLLTNGAEYYPQLRLAHWQWFALWTVHLVPNVNKQTWTHRVTLALQKSPHWTTRFLGKILIFPSLMLPGRHIEYKGKSLIILRESDNHIQVFDSDKVSELPPTVKVNGPGVYVPQEDFNRAILRLAPVSVYPHVFSIEHPPKSLLRVLNELNRNDIDISSLSHAVEHDENFSTFVQQAATQSNRQNIQVRSVKQAVMTYGTERLGDMLVTHALYQRLTQQDFPAKSMIMDHLDLVMALSSEIAFESDIMLPQTACLITLLCHSALFTSPELKTTRSWELSSDIDLASLAAISPDKTLSLLKISATRIAKSWRIQNRIIALVGSILSENSGPGKVRDLVYLAVIWAIQVKQGQLDYTEPNAIEKAIMSRLTLTAVNKLHCLQELSDKIRCTLVKH